MNEKLTIIAGNLKGETFQLVGDKIAIGREDSNEIVLRDSSVSRQHCIIEKHDDQFFINDLQSLNGTFINGNQAENTPLEPRR